MKTVSPRQGPVIGPGPGLQQTLDARLGPDEPDDLTVPEATTHFTLWCTGRAVVLVELASGLAKAALIAAIVIELLASSSVQATGCLTD
jgi:hypothetical protein